MNIGTRLIAEIDSATVGRSQVALWWLGQHSFVLKANSTVIYLDPFLTDLPDRLIPPFLAAGDITNAAVIAGTHDHTDHIDRAVWPDLAKASPMASFVVPDLLRHRLADDLKIPASKLVGLDDGQTTELAGVRISAIASAHEFLDRDEKTGKYPYLGYVVEASGLTIYHAGDCCIYEGLVTKLRRWKFDVMILPINGRDAVRYASGCIGNMTYQEAADLAGAVGAKIVIPAHYDMFAANLGPVQAFADYVRVKYPAMLCHICRYTERFNVE